MKIVVTGGTGFIGGTLCRALAARGDEVVVLTRYPREGPAGPLRQVGWQPGVPGSWAHELDGAEAVVNLAGEPIVGQRWTAASKHRIIGSRLDATASIVDALRRASRRPPVLINASAIGYYGPRGDEEITERDGPGSDFLAETCQRWEAAAQAAEPLGVRVMRLRIGMVLSVDGGALAKMLPAFRLGLGGPLGGGRQWLSWIQRDDLVNLILHLLQRPDASGAVNATAQNPVTMRDFAAALGQAVHRPAVFPVPGVALRLLLGEVADLLLTGQRVIPTAAVRLGYGFRYPTLPEALTACLGPRPGAG